MAGNTQDNEQRVSSINPQQEELRLSVSCDELLRLWYSLDMRRGQEQEDTFWHAFNEFYKHINKAKERYRIEYMVDRLTDIKSKIEVMSRNKQNYSETGSLEHETLNQAKIVAMYNRIIGEIQKIKDKALVIEGDKTEETSSKWASQFLINYYNIIVHIGALNQILSTMLNEIDMPERFKRNLKYQQLKLFEMKKEMMTLNASDCPPEIIEHLTTVSTQVSQLIEIYNQQQQASNDVQLAFNINETYTEAKLKETLLAIYRETLDKCFP